MINEAPESDNQGVIRALLQLSRADGALLRVVTERKKIEKNVEKARAATVEAQENHRRVLEVTSKVKSKFSQEEKWIQEEREKIKNRRKAAGSFSGFRVQQNAVKEIERAEHLLSAREDSLLLMLEQVEKADALIAESEAKVKACETREKEAVSNIQGTYGTLETRYAEHKASRDAIAATIPTEALRIYETVKSKHPMDPVAPIKGKSCSACFMGVQPQQIVDMLHSGAIVRCRGCKRILSPEPVAELAGEGK